MKRLLLRALGIALAVLALDQGIKEGLRQLLSPCTVAMALHTCAHLAVLGTVTLVRLQSNGGLPGVLPLFSLSTLVAALGLVLIPLYARWLARAGWPAVLAIGLQAGGALSNLVDRLVFGASLDYLPAGHIVFNLADVALLGGMVLAMGLLVQRPVLSGHRDGSQPHPFDRASERGPGEDSRPVATPGPGDFAHAPGPAALSTDLPRTEWDDPEAHRRRGGCRT